MGLFWFSFVLLCFLSGCGDSLRAKAGKKSTLDGPRRYILNGSASCLINLGMVP